MVWTAVWKTCTLVRRGLVCAVMCNILGSHHGHIIQTPGLHEIFLIYVLSCEVVFGHTLFIGVLGIYLPFNVLQC